MLFVEAFSLSSDWIFVMNSKIRIWLDINICLNVLSINQGNWQFFSCPLLFCRGHEVQKACILPQKTYWQTFVSGTVQLAKNRCAFACFTYSLVYHIIVFYYTLTLLWPMFGDKISVISCRMDISSPFTVIACHWDVTMLWQVNNIAFYGVVNVQA